jgi:2',3'-cyclic-nucleotide 2'-phosphodiesterase (5'-nucleotidase family)
MKTRFSKLMSVLLTLALVIGLLGVPGTTAKAETGDVTITLLETTDVHGHMVEVTNLSDKSTNQYRLAYMAKLFDNYRSQGNVILLNGGDSFQGTPISNFSYGKYVVNTFNAMDYDAHALGNHEFDWGLDAVLTKNGTYINSTTPVLACNIYYAGTKNKIPYTQDYTIIERGGKKVAVIGWAAEYSVDIMAAMIAPYTISEDVSLVNNLAKELKDSKKADAVIVLAHQDAAEAAELFDHTYVDFLFGGHSHKTENGQAKSGIPYAEANCYGYGFSKATMTIKGNGGVTVDTPSFVSIYDKTKLSTLYNTPENASNLDSEIVSICDRSIEAVKPKLNKEIADLPVALDRTYIPDSLTTTMGNFVTDLMLSGQKDVDFAFCNDGGIRCNFDAKKLTTYDMYTVFPFNNLIYKVQMTGSQVVKLLEQIVGNDSSNMQMAGLTAKYDLTLPEDQQVFDICLADGTPIDLNKTYTILTNEYIATGGNKYSVFLTDVVSKTNTKALDNETVIASLNKLGAKGTLNPDLKARFVKGTLEAPAVTTKTADLYEGNNLQLVFSNLLGTADITYSSSNSKVAKVDKKGLITAVKAGTVTITSAVKQVDTTYKLQTKITVKKPSITFSSSTGSIKLGKSYAFKAKTNGITGTVTWTSSNKSVAAVSSTGKVISKKEGTTVITATIGNYTVSKKIKVTK